MKRLQQLNKNHQIIITMKTKNTNNTNTSENTINSITNNQNSNTMENTTNTSTNTTAKAKKTAEEVAAAAAARYEKHVAAIAAAAAKAENWRGANGAGNMASRQQKAAALNAAAAIYWAIDSGKRAEDVDFVAAAVTYLKGVIIAAAEGDLKATIAAVGEVIPAEVLAAAVATDGSIKPHNVARRMAAAIAANEETAIAVEMAARKAEKKARHEARKAEKKAAAAAKKAEKKA